MKIIVTNRKARFEYEIIETYTSGICLQGSEVKSIKAGHISIVEAYCYITNGEIFLKGANISPHKCGEYTNHIPVRDRKLLLKKKEILKLEELISQKGLTIVPLEIIISSTGFVKLQIGLAKGKNLYDKKQSIRLRDLDRELKQNID